MVGLTNKKESCLERAKSCFQALEYKQQCRVWSRKKELLKTDYNMTDDNLTTLYDFLTNEKEVSIDKVTNMLRGNLSEDSWTS